MVPLAFRGKIPLKNTHKSLSLVHRFANSSIDRQTELSSTEIFVFTENIKVDKIRHRKKINIIRFVHKYSDHGKYIYV
jgi:hypothetical protein